MKIAERVRIMERVIRRLALAFDEDDNDEAAIDQVTLLIESDDFRTTVEKRGFWLEVKALEDAEDDFRVQAAEAVRARGIETVRLIILDPDEITPPSMILTMPGRTKLEEECIVKALHVGIMSTVGGVLMEHEVTRTVLTGIIRTIGTMIPEVGESQLQQIATAMMKMDLGALREIVSPYLEAMQAKVADVTH